MKIKKNNIILVLISIIILFIVYFVLDQYKPKFSIKNLSKYEANYVSVSENSQYIFIKPKKYLTLDTGIIFYPDKFVNEKSYLPLLFELAKDGYGIYILKSPLNVPLFSRNKANDIIKNGDFEKYALMGHSYGGKVLLDYISKQNQFSEKITDAILLAACSSGRYVFDSVKNKDYKNEVRMLSIVGSKDGVLNLLKYDNDKENLPKNTKYITINGGNNSNFGNYGKKYNDFKSDISLEKQQYIVLNEINEFLKRYN